MADDEIDVGAPVDVDMEECELRQHAQLQARDSVLSKERRSRALQRHL